MATTTFPSSGDQITEASWTALNRALAVSPSYRVSGYVLSDGGGLNASVSAGTCLVNGKAVVSDGAQTAACTASQTNYVFLNADGTLTVNTTGTNPGSNALLLGTVVTGVSTISSISHDVTIDSGLWWKSRISANANRNNTTTLSTVGSSAERTVAAGEQWMITVMLRVSAASPTPDIKFDWDVSGGSLDAQYNHIFGPTDNGSANYGSAANNGAVTHALEICTDNAIILKSLVQVNTGGTLQLRVAQATATVADVTVLADSVIIGRRVI